MEAEGQNKGLGISDQVLGVRGAEAGKPNPDSKSQIQEKSGSRESEVGSLESKGKCKIRRWGRRRYSKGCNVKRRTVRYKVIRNSNPVIG